jgi:hypothetical protein
LRALQAQEASRTELIVYKLLIVAKGNTFFEGAGQQIKNLETK